jgi:hypothetical protein
MATPIVKVGLAAAGTIKQSPDGLSATYSLADLPPAVPLKMEPPKCPYCDGFIGCVQGRFCDCCGRVLPAGK